MCSKLELVTHLQQRDNAMKRPKIQEQIAPSRAALYLRVSTEDQASSGYGLDVQEQKCTAMAMVKGWQIVHTFRDEGISGTKDASARPALAAMLDAASNGEIDAVIVLALDRLGRKTRLVLELVEQLEGLGVELVSVKENLDTSTPQGRFVLGIFAVLGQLERDMIVQRTTDGRNLRGKLDGEKGGRVPYAYVRTDSGIGVLDEQAEIVRYILRNKRGGKSLRKIAQTLNEQGKAGPYGGQWYARTVKIICDNRPIYAGGQRGDSGACWPAII